MAQCEACGGDMKGRRCQECGALAAYGGKPEAPEARRVCPFDGATLNADGFCGVGQGFPITLRYCPDVCPYCRHGLRWDGDCDSCRPPGEKPGHLYDPINAHWQITERGPQKIAPAGVALESMFQITQALTLQLTQIPNQSRKVVEKAGNGPRFDAEESNHVDIPL